MEALGRILLVEDDPKDVELTLTALDEYNLANEVVVAGDGEQALDYLYCRGNFMRRARENPAVLLLDLKLPKVDGLEVLKQIKGDEHLKMIPVVVLTSSHEEKDMVASYATGRQCVCSEAGGFPRIRKRYQGARRLLGGNQRSRHPGA